MLPPLTTPEAKAIAQAELRRIHEMEISGTLTRINYAMLTPIERLGMACKRKTK